MTAARPQGSAGRSAQFRSSECQKCGHGDDSVKEVADADVLVLTRSGANGSGTFGARRPEQEMIR